MKKTKFLLAILLASSLVACGDQGNSNSVTSDDDSSLTSSSSSSLPSSTGSLSTSNSLTDSSSSTGSSSATESTSTITEAEWENIFENINITNATYITTSRMVATNDTFNGTIKVENPTKTQTTYITSSSLAQTQSYEEEILNKEENDYYSYLRNSPNGIFTRTTITVEEFNQKLEGKASPALSFSSMIKQFNLKDKFNDFSVDSTQNAYVGTMTMSISPSSSISYDCVIKFVEKKLFSFTMHTDNEEVEGTSILSDIGTTTVTIPTDYDEQKKSPYEVSEDEWQKIFEDINLTNGTSQTIMSSTDPEQNLETIITCEVESPTKVRSIFSYSFDNESQSYEEKIYDHSDDKYYEYSRVATSELEADTLRFERKTKSEESFYEDLLNGNMILNFSSGIHENYNLIENYDQFTFDSTQNAYVGTININLDVDFSTECNFVIEFDEDKTLSYLEMEFDVDNSHYLSKIQNIGDTTVTIPTDFIDKQDSQIEQFKEILSEINESQTQNKAQDQHVNFKLQGTVDGNANSLIEFDFTNYYFHVFAPEGGESWIYVDQDNKVIVAIDMQGQKMYSSVTAASREQAIELWKETTNSMQTLEDFTITYATEILEMLDNINSYPDYSININEQFVFSYDKYSATFSSGENGYVLTHLDWNNGDSWTISFNVEYALPDLSQFSLMPMGPGM